MHVYENFGLAFVSGALFDEFIDNPTLEESEVKELLKRVGMSTEQYEKEKEKRKSQQHEELLYEKEFWTHEHKFFV